MAWLQKVSTIGGILALLIFVAFSTVNCHADSAYLVDNYKIIINGKVVNSNSDFETGDLSGFNYAGDVRVMNQLGSISPYDGSNYLAFASNSISNWADLMVPPYILPENYDSISLSITYLILTNEDPTIQSADWFHYHYYHYYDASEPDYTIHDLMLYYPISSAPFTAAPIDTGFRWMTKWRTVSFDIKGDLAKAMADGISVHLGIGHESPVPDRSLTPVRMLLLEGQ
ncbi:MAG: hypothetical protein AB9866_13905 [Syntrophobacteraceae bacterium]